jgi:hypothetical protein
MVAKIRKVSQAAGRNGSFVPNDPLLSECKKNAPRTRRSMPVAVKPKTTLLSTINSTPEQTLNAAIGFQQACFANTRDTYLVFVHNGRDVLGLGLRGCNSHRQARTRALKAYRHLSQDEPLACHIVGHCHFKCRVCRGTQYYVLGCLKLRKDSGWTTFEYPLPGNKDFPEQLGYLIADQAKVTRLLLMDPNDPWFLNEVMAPLEPVRLPKTESKTSVSKENE